MFDEIQTEERKNKVTTLKAKFDNKTINFKELRELMKKTRKSLNIGIFYTDFYSVNMHKPKPEELNFTEYGKFFTMLNLMSRSNELTHLGNNKRIKKETLSTMLEFKNIKAFYNFINKLSKYKMLAKIKLGGANYIAINPAYAQRKIMLNSTIYKLFKEDLDEFLDEYQLRYLELYEESVDIDSIISLE